MKIVVDQQANLRLARSFAPRAALAVIGLILILMTTGCTQSVQVTEGTIPRHYPYDAPTGKVVDIQVFRNGSEIELVNMTANSYQDFDLWLNERYLRHVKALPAGGTIRLSLFEFVDEYSEGLKAGGWLSTGHPDPIIKAEIESPDRMVQLVAIAERGK